MELFNKKELTRMRHDAIRTRTLIEMNQDQLYSINDFLSKTKGGGTNGLSRRKHTRP